MNATLVAIQAGLNALIVQIPSVVPSNEPLGVAHSNWGLPSLTRSEFVQEAQSIFDLITERGAEEISNEDDLLIKDYVRRLEFLRAQTIPQLWGGNGGQAASAYMLTLAGLRKAIEPVLTRDGRADAVVALRTLTTKLRGMEATLNALEPRTGTMAAMVDRIEKAYSAADQLPGDLETLSEARKQLEVLLHEAIKDQGRLADIKREADEFDRKLSASVDGANEVLAKCETAYSAATSVGLAAAFTERSNALSNSMWFWVGGLVVALGVGSVFGSAQLHTLSELFKQPSVTLSIVVLNLLLSLLSVGAPIWFGWLATKQIGQRFRLAEDYAFKASISRAYEGFRREASRFDKDMEARVLASALSRLEEQPLRLIETETHGSPWHELASSDLIKEAMRAVPGFAGQVKELASKVVASASASKGTSAATKPTPDSTAA